MLLRVTFTMQLLKRGSWERNHTKAKRRYDTECGTISSFSGHTTGAGVAKWCLFFCCFISQHTPLRRSNWCRCCHWCSNCPSLMGHVETCWWMHNDTKENNWVYKNLLNFPPKKNFSAIRRKWRKGEEERERRMYNNDVAYFFLISFLWDCQSWRLCAGMYEWECKNTCG